MTKKVVGMNAEGRLVAPMPSRRGERPLGISHALAEMEVAVEFRFVKGKATVRIIKDNHNTPPPA